MGLGAEPPAVSIGYEREGLGATDSGFTVLFSDAPDPEELGDEYRPIVATLAFAGLRVSEALALRWRDVDLKDGTLDVRGTKTAGSKAPVPIIDALSVELKAHRSRLAERGLHLTRADALVFTQDRRNVLRAVYRAGDDAGLNPDGAERIGCHDLRHSCAGLLFAAGMSAPTVAAVLRHADTRTTLTTYAGLVETDEPTCDMTSALPSPTATRGDLRIEMRAANARISFRTTKRVRLRAPLRSVPRRGPRNGLSRPSHGRFLRVSP